MDPKELQRQIAECYAKLTPEAQAVFSSMEWLETLKTISEKYQLTEEQMQALGTETMLVLLGITSAGEYERIVWDNLKLSEKNARDLFSEINLSILRDIRPQLAKTFYKNNKPTTEKLKETIKTEMVKLPKETQEVISTFDWRKISEEIGKKYLLNPTQINNLQDQIGLILTEAIDLDFIVASIENNLDVENEQAIKISEEVIQKIFRPMTIKLVENIKKSLKIRNVNWQQNLDFILSGGDYTTFIRRAENLNKSEETPKTNTLDPSKIDNLKSKFTI